MQNDFIWLNLYSKGNCSSMSQWAKLYADEIREAFEKEKQNGLVLVKVRQYSTGIVLATVYRFILYSVVNQDLPFRSDLHAGNLHNSTNTLLKKKLKERNQKRKLRRKWRKLKTQPSWNPFPEHKRGREGRGFLKGRLIGEWKLAARVGTGDRIYYPRYLALLCVAPEHQRKGKYLPRDLST
jgi:hypothetical protein